MHTLLKKLHCKVDVAINGVEAVVAYSKNNYDLILMDCSMPKLDGFEATKNIRELEKKHNKKNNLPIIALTAHDNDSNNRNKCKKFGMNDFIAKPFKSEEFLNTIKKWLR